MLVRKNDIFSPKSVSVTQIETGEWTRFNNYFTIRTPEEAAKSFGPSVEFRNKAKDVIVSEIVVSSAYEKISVTLQVCPIKINKVMSLVKELFNEGEYRQSEFKIRIYITLNKATLCMFKKLFKNINEKIAIAEFKKQDIPSGIYAELEQILRFTDDSNSFINQNSHYIPVGTSKALERAQLARPMNLVNMIRLAAEFYDEDEIKKYIGKYALIALTGYLMRDFDPNEVDQLGKSLLYSVINLDSYQVDAEIRYFMVELLLSYGAKPFDRDNGVFFFSPFEIAYTENKSAELNLIQLSVTKPGKQITSNGIDLFSSQANPLLGTYFYFENKETLAHTHIHAQLKTLDQLTSFEKFCVYTIFKRYFKHPTNDIDKLNAVFAEDFAATDKKWIELIYNKDHEIVGFYVFEFLKNAEKTRYTLKELLNNKEDLKRITLHSMYSALLPEYRDYGIIKLIWFRPAFALEKLVPKECKVGVFFCSIHSNSYRMVANFKSVFPKHKLPDHNSTELPTHIKDIFHQVYGDDVRYHYDGGLNCYLIENEPLILVDDAKEDINDRFFNKYLAGSSTEDHRGVPFYFETKPNYNIFTKSPMLNEKIKTTVSDHLDYFAMQILKMVNRTEFTLSQKHSIFVAKSSQQQRESPLHISLRSRG